MTANWISNVYKRQWQQTNSLLKRIFTFHTFHIIFFTFFHTQIQILARHGKKWAWTSVVSLFSHTFFPFFPPTYLYCGDLGKKWGWTPSFHIHYPHPQIQMSTRFAKKWSWSPTGQIFICDRLCVWAQHGIWYKYNKHYYKYNICFFEILDRSNTHTR